MDNVEIYPGLNKTILTALEMKVCKLYAKEKLVAIAMDEMAIKEGLAYNARKYVIEGPTVRKMLMSSFSHWKILHCIFM